MKPYYQDSAVTIYHGDARLVRPNLGQVDVIVSDPPYGVDVALNTKGERIKGDDSTELRDWLIAYNPGAAMMVFGSPKIARPVGDFFTLIWDKSELTGMGDLNWPWKLVHEEIYVFGSGFVAARRAGSVLDFPLRPAWTNHPDAVSGLHPNEKPLSLMKSLVACCPKGVVYDFFGGIGSTARACKDLGRECVMVELEERYCEIAARRMGQEVLAL